jgi:hypothetical protein
VQEARYEAFGRSHGLKGNVEPTKAQQAEIVESVLAPNIQRQIDAVKARGAPSGEE